MKHWIARAEACLALTVATQIVLATPAMAYGPRETHRWLTRMAVDHLVRAYPGDYDELLDYVDAVAFGSEHEDNYLLDGDSDARTLRVMRHFFRPTDGAGLTLNSLGTFPNSLEWATRAEGNAWRWGNGIRAYADGNEEEAYFILGHIVHLIQDLTVPAHTHLDIHPPPHGDDFENYASSMMLGEFDSLLPRPAPDAPIPEFSDLEEAWYATAYASYWRNRYPGALSDRDAPEGVIADMFPDLSVHWFWEEWHIGEPPVGYLNSNFFEDEEEPGWFYFKTLRYPAQVDKMEFDPREPTDLSGLAENLEETPMVELVAQDMIPLAILHSAAVMKLYLDEAYARAPDSGGGLPPPYEGGTSASTSMCATATPSGMLGGGLVALVLSPLIFPRRRVSGSQR